MWRVFLVVFLGVAFLFTSRVATINRSIGTHTITLTATDSISIAVARPVEFTLVIVSDITNEWWNGTVWKPAVACWVHPDWPIIHGATWIWRSYLVDSEELFGPITFRKIFTIPEEAFDITGYLSITADNAYEIYLNSNFIGRDGFVTDPPITYKKDPLDEERWRSIETYNITPALRRSINEILIRAVNYRNWVDPYMNPAGVVYKAIISFKVPPKIPATIDINPDTSRPAWK